MGVYSQLLTVSNLFTFVLSFGLPVGIVKYVSEWTSENKESDANDLMFQIIAFGSIVSLVFVVIFFFVSGSLSELLFDSTEYSLLVVICSLSFPFVFILTVLDSFIRGLKQFAKYVKLSLILAFAGVIVPVVLVYFYGEFGAALSIFVNSVFALILIVFFVHKNKLMSFKITTAPWNYKFDVIKNIMKLGVASLFVGLLDQLIYAFLKTTIVKELGMIENGIYQCALSISNNYINIFFVTMSVYYLPVLSSIKEQNALNNEINIVIRFTILLLLPIITISFVFRTFLIEILFSEEFLRAQDLLFYMFLGDFLKALSWVMGMWMIATLRIKAWVIIDCFYYGSFFILFYVLVNHFDFGLVSLSLSYFVACCLKFTFDLIYLRKKNSFRFGSGNAFLMTSSLLSILLLFGISLLNEQIGYFAVLPVLVIFYYLTVDNKEMTELKKLLRTSLKIHKK